MMKQDIIQFQGKTIKLLLKNSYNYTGDILSISDDSITLLDKYHNTVLISINDITTIMEVQ